MTGRLLRFRKIKSVYLYTRLLAALLLVGSALTPTILTASASANPTISEYNLPTSPSWPTDITRGSDGNLWFINSRIPGELGRITPAGTVSQYAIGSSATPQYLSAEPDGNLWFTLNQFTIAKMTTSGAVTTYNFPMEEAVTNGEQSGASSKLVPGPDGNLWFADGYFVGSITPAGAVTQYPVYYPTTSISMGSDGNLWFTTNGWYVGKITTSGAVTMYNLPNAQWTGITTGPDGNLWATDMLGNRIALISTAGTFTTYAIPTSNSDPQTIASGPDGALWFTERNASKIARITTSGAITEYNIPTASAAPFGITTGPNNDVWFTEHDADKIGKLSLVPSAPTDLMVSTPTQQSKLSWVGVTGATYYNIYRNNSLIDTISADNTTYADSLAPEGTDSYYVTAVSTGGESSPSNTVSTLVDRTAPTITYTLTPIADSNGNNTGSVRVTFTCIDNTGGSGIASCPSPVTVDNEGIGHTVAATSTDNAGNSTTIQANASLLVRAIDTGGGASGNYTADTGFTGGQPYTSSTTVGTSEVTTMPAPQAVYQSVRYGKNLSYEMTGLTPEANYTLRLHFNELYWGTSLAFGGDGSRVFNVAVNGQPALSNFDIYKTAGGANKAIVEELPVTADANGAINIQFTTITDNAMVNGIELYQGTLPTEPPAISQATATSAFINAGGSNIGSFANDTGFTGGTAYTSTASVDTSNVTNPAPQAVYQSVRYGNFNYNIPNLVPDTVFHVCLDFNELYWGTPLANSQGGDGSRTFNVSINGMQVLSNFDIYKTAGGANKAIVEDFDATSDSEGNINIQFVSVTDNAMVSGIEITQ